MTLSALRAAKTLRVQRMPFDEIRAVLTADDPEIVRRYLELHQERLAERYADEQRAVARLARAIRDPRGIRGREPR
ncbi:MAG: hypothetical protein ACRDGK_08980 [Actinomycetota bacterium]